MQPLKIVKVGLEKEHKILDFDFPEFERVCHAIANQIFDIVSNAEALETSEQMNFGTDDKPFLCPHESA